MENRMNAALSFDDVLLVPKRALLSRDDANISTSLGPYHLTLPILSANMSSVTESEMASDMRRAGGAGVIHRMCSPERQIDIVNDTRLKFVDNGFSTGPYIISIENGDKGVERAIQVSKKSYVKEDKFIYCIDVAHAYSSQTVLTIQKLYAAIGPNTLIIGNIATPQAADYIIAAVGPSMTEKQNIYFKVGVGGGSQCTTRIVTGSGLPTFESLWRFKNHKGPEYKIIADGGIKNSGDIVKCLAAGADMVMLGSLLAGTKQAPGEIIKHHGDLYKVYRGSASFGQQTEYSHKEGEVSYVEGEETLVPYKGDAFKILKQLEEGIKSGFSYCGARNLNMLQSTAEFVQITNSGFKESQPHGAL